MFRTSDMILIAVMVSAAAFTYRTKHETEGTKREIGRLERQIKYEEETIDVLKADWALLTQPDRLQTLADTYQDQLHLKQIEPGQVIELSDIPPRLPDPTGDDGLTEAMAATGHDNVKTGSVRP